MTAYNIRQIDIADALHVSKSTVSHWFSGRHNPSMEQLRGIAGMLEIPLAELLEDDDTLARDTVEVEMLRKLRSVPADKRQEVAALIGAMLDAMSNRGPLDP